MTPRPVPRPADRRLIVVSNRGPVSFHREPDGRLVPTRGSGGLVTALRAAARDRDVTWIASARTDADRVAARAGAAGVVDLGDGMRASLIVHDDDAFRRFSTVVANPTLWFLHHHLWSLADAPDLGVEFEAAWDEGYRVVNEAFAGAVLDELDRGGPADVLYQDYHLYLAPGVVREQRPDVRQLHFVHVPWPESDMWSVLPDRMRREIHCGLLANDVVAFHTARWCRSFLRSCEDVLGASTDHLGGRVTLDGTETVVRARPISLDPAEFDELARRPDVRERGTRLRRERTGRLILRVDRTDPSKNVVRGLRAYALLLAEHPELHGEVQMFALLDPSRQELEEYRAYVGRIEAEARAIDERFGTPTWRPLVLQIADDFPLSVAAYGQFDVLLVNAIFDGLNLVAKEAALVNETDGVIVLSTNAGAYEELAEWVLPVDPCDVSGQARALHEALVLPAADRRRRLKAIREHVRANDASAWLQALLADLDAAASTIGR